MDRTPMLAGNWKMHKTINEAIDLTVRLKYACKDIDDRDVVVCPPYTALQAVSETVADSDIEVGAQNMHFEESGAYTGEISPLMVKDAGCEWTILGHSERREYFNEDAESLQKKIEASIEHEIKVFFCIGENEEQREAGELNSVIQRQLEEVFVDFSAGELEELVVAYEPLWAIGTGNPATPEQANEAHQIVRENLADLFNEELAGRTRVVYGGSVKPHNVEDIMDQPHIDGALVGGASLSAEDFASIINFDSEESEIPAL